MSSEQHNGTVIGNGAPMEQALRASTLNHHRPLEAAQEGILILDADTGRIKDVNPFLVKLLGFSRGEMVGKTVGELSPFRDIVVNQAMLERLQKHGHVRLENLSLEIRRIDVEFACNIDQAGDKKVIQCNIREITGCKRAEAALRESEGKFSKIFHASPLPVALSTIKEGRYLDVNAEFLKMFGWSREEVVGHTAFELNFWVNQKDRATAVSKLQEHHSVRNLELDIRIKSGQIRRILWSVELVVLGNEQCILGTSLDITERRRMELALANERALLRNLVDNLPLAVYLKDTAGHKTLANLLDLRNQGVTSEMEIRGKTDFDLFPPDQAAAFAADDQRVFNGQPVLNREEKLTRPDGTDLWLLTSKVPLRDATGRLTGLVGFGLDITERRQAEASNVRLATAVEQSADTILITDIHGKILYANPAFEKSSGYTRAEALGQNTRILKSGKQDAEFYRRMWDVLQRGEVWSGHFINRRKDGALYEEEATLSPVRDAAGAIVNYVAVKHDVTRELQLEAQIRQAQKMEAVGQLAGGVAHDFNNLLGVIIGYNDLLVTDLDPDSPLRTYAEEIRRAAEHAARLTQQLLVFSRKQKVQPVVLDLNDTVKDLEKMLRRLIGENIEMMIVPGKEIGRIQADPGHIGQVLMNLAINARDAMPDGGKLTIATSNVTPDENHPSWGNGADHPAAQFGGVIPPGKQAHPGGYVLLTVSDTGTGMTPEVKARLFEALFTTKPAGKGTGLGLATCLTIVHQSGGFIEVDSEAGQGAAFKVYFPRVDKPVEAAVGSGQAGSLPRGTETLLVVEDEPSVRHLAWKVLEALGYQVLRANNGQDALQMVREHKESPVRLVVTDVVMPRMGGKVMADWLKTIYPDIKILFTSGYTDDAIGQHGVLEPGVAFLPKPYTPAVLARKVRAMLDDETDTSLLRKRGATNNQPSTSSA